MKAITKIVDDIYDSKIEDPEYQKFMRSCIKAWLRDAVEKGMILGKEEFALEMEKLSKKYMNPDAIVCVMKAKE